MSRLKQNDYLEYKHPIHVVWRKGTPEDPYVDKIDIMPVVNQRIILSEIPDKLTKLKISNMVEINHERFIQDTLEPNEYYCDYTNGFVYFHRHREADTIGISYKARGYILYPSTRIYHINGQNIKETIFETIERTEREIDELIERTKNYEEYLEKIKENILDSERATAQAQDAADYTTTVIKELEKSVDSTQLIWKHFVETEKDIAVEFPNPQVGWTTQAKDTGIRYRYDGKEWVPIDIFTNNIPLATNTTDGLMSSKDYKYLHSISPQVNKRTMVFVYPNELPTGALPLHIMLEYQGVITGINASVERAGIEDVKLMIEKSKDYKKWEKVLEEPVIIPADEHFSVDELNEYPIEAVAGEVYRIRVERMGQSSNLTLNINMLTDKSQIN